MADFTDRDKDILDRLFKAYEKTAHTDASRDPWHELYGRDTTVNAQRAAMAADVLQGWSGSWTSAYNYGFTSVVVPFTTPPSVGLQNNDPDAGPVPIRAKTTKLGLRGIPDVDFVPYNWRTNRFGSKGPALVGHPISYEVEGPTLKSPACDWTWEVRGGDGPNGGDFLIMSDRSDGGAATCLNLAEGYNLPDFTIGDPSEPEGGLYLLITDDGTDPGSIPSGETALAPLSPAEDTARYEIFRVSAISTNPGSGRGEIELHPSKPLSRIFSLPDFVAPGDERFIRSVTLIRPYVTRLAAIQGSGVVNTLNVAGTGQGRERSFLVISPERAASSDLFPPFDGQSTGDGTWLRGGFTESGAPGSENGAPPFPVGTASTYMGRVELPIPIPISEKVGAVETGTDPIPSVPVGNWLFTDSSASGADAGRILRINQAERPETLDGLAYGKDTTAVMGWWPIEAVNGAPTGFILSRVPEVDPETGRIYYGPGPYVIGVLPTVGVSGTLHDPIRSLFTGPFDPDRTEASRIKNLIDPRYVARDPKRVSSVTSSTVQPFGSSAGRSDQATFPTETFSTGAPILDVADPGSLLDLGFRMVLFPAKDDGSGNAIPDFDKPITSREIIIDSEIAEPQFIDIDYSGGVVRLSHPPPDRIDPASAIVPNGWPGTGVPGSNNERGEAVLFAACVPYSMEENQLGTGNRITTQNENGRDIDVFSRQINANVDLTNTDLSTGSPPFVGPSSIAPSPVEIVLDRIWEGPETGVITMTTGGLQGSSFGNWAYTETREVTVGSETVTALGGISSQPFPVPLDPVDGAGDVRTVVLRREVNFGLQSAGLNLIDDYELDTVYGSSARARSVRFDNADLTYELDGSVLIRSPGADLLDQLWHQWGYISASGIEGAGTEELLSDIGVLAGLFYEDTANPNGGGSTGEKASFDDGQVHVFTAAPTEFSGFLTRQAQIRISQVFRLIVKFDMGGSFEFPPDPDGTYFIGLTTPDPGIAPGSVADALTVPPPAGIDLAGLRFNGLYLDPEVTEFEFFMQRAGGSSLSVSTGVLPPFPGGGDLARFYFVMESSRNSPIVKFRLYDENIQLLSSHDQIDATPLPLPSSDLEFVSGVQTNSVNDVFNLNFYFASIANRVDLKAPKI